METGPSGSPMQATTGSGEQQNSSRCSGLMGPNLKYLLAAAEASLLRDGLGGWSIACLQATVKLGGSSP